MAEPSGSKTILLTAHESSYRIGFPLFFLAILSLIIGYCSKDLFVGLGTPFWGSALIVKPEAYIESDAEFINYTSKIWPLCLSFFGSLTAFFIYLFNLNFFFKSSQNSLLVSCFNFVVKKWYFDKFYNQILGQSILNIGYAFSYKDVDRGLLEFFGPLNIAKSLQKVSKGTAALGTFFFIQTFSFLSLFVIYIILFALGVVSLYQIIVPFLIALNVKWSKF